MVIICKVSIRQMIKFQIQFSKTALSLGLKLLRSTVIEKDVFTPTGGRIVLITNSKADKHYPNRDLLINNVSIWNLFLYLLVLNKLLYLYTFIVV